MTIYDFITTGNVEDVTFSIFDCITQETIEVETDDGTKKDLTNDELYWSSYADYEIGGFDVWYDRNNGCVHIEFNIDIEEEE